MCVVVLAVISVITMALLWTFLTATEKFIKVITSPRPCSCHESSHMRGSKEIKTFLDQNLPWLNESTKMQLKKRHPNLPVEFLYQYSSKRVCYLLPSLTELKWINHHWQETKLSDNSIIYLYSAFYDPAINIAGNAGLRLLGMTTNLDPPHDYCQMWYSASSPPLVAKVVSIVYLDYQMKTENHSLPYMVTCAMPDGVHAVPVAVSLVPRPCHKAASNLLQVTGAAERDTYISKKGNDWVPAVCGPALFFYHHDFSQRLVEWLEVLRAEGFGRVFLYVTDVHPNIDRVLRHYEAEGFVQVTDFTYPPHHMNEPSLRRLWRIVENHKMFAQENIYFTDCLLRHMHQYRYIAHYDPDELPVLPSFTSFSDFLQMFSRKNGRKIGFHLTWSYFYNDLEPGGEGSQVPDFLWALRHSRHLTKELAPWLSSVKPLYDMDKVRATFSHGPLWCTFGPCSFKQMAEVPRVKGYLAHFKNTCGAKCKNQSKIEEETWLLSFKDQVSLAVETVLRKLKLFHKMEPILL